MSYNIEKRIVWAGKWVLAMASYIKANIIIFAIDGISSEFSAMRAVYLTLVQSCDAANPRLEGYNDVSKARVRLTPYVARRMCQAL